MDGHTAAPGWGQVGGNGMALSHCPYWIPMISVANIRLEKGIHVINLRIRNAGAAGEVSLHGVGVTIKIFHEKILTIGSDGKVTGS